MKPLRNISNICTGTYKPEGKSFRDVVQYKRRPRTRSSVTIWSLPKEVLAHMLGGLHVRDLLAFRSVHPYFRDLIDSNGTLWKNISFAGSWPSDDNLCHFTSAAEKKNVEASIKLAVAYLYKEGVCKETNSEVGEKSAHYFWQAESLTPKVFPFSWIFVRPPWSPDGSCCKAKTFQHIKAIAHQTQNSDLCFGVGLTMKLLRLTGVQGSKVDEMKYLNMAVASKSNAASFFILLDMDTQESSQSDKAKELERVRSLRMIAGTVLEARLVLIRHYVQGQYGGITHSMAQSYVRDWFQSSGPSRIDVTFSTGPTSDTSRFILVDWLVEVLTMKNYSTHTLYLAVSLVDRFLQTQPLQRSQVQLLGVAAMVLSSRYLGFDILTIREAAWLTDNSYNYQEVVRMMGELVAALSGNLRVLNIHDYVMVLAPLVDENCQSAILMEYLAMLCLLQSEMGQYSSAEIACSCLLLSRLLLDSCDPWPRSVQEWTGYSQDYLSLCTFHIYNKCLLEGSDVNYRETKLEAVKTRYADPARCSISNIKIISHEDLCRRLGVTKLVTCGQHTKAVKFRNTDELIMSPNRGQGHDLAASDRFRVHSLDRRLSATPPIDVIVGQEEPASGYDGDQEDISDESYLNKSNIGEDSELWDSTLDESNDDDEELSTDDEHGVSLSQSFDSISERVEKFAGCSFRPQQSPCLSSMCQLGTKVSYVSSPVACIANCWCGRARSVSGSVSAPEIMFSDSSMTSPLAGSNNFTSSNVEACIPRGSIAKHSRRVKDACAKVCDSMQYQGKTCNKGCARKSKEGKGKVLTRSKSLQDITQVAASSCLHTDKSHNHVHGTNVGQSQEKRCNNIHFSKQTTEEFMFQHLDPTSTSSSSLFSSIPSSSSSTKLPLSSLFSPKASTSTSSSTSVPSSQSKAHSSRQIANSLESPGDYLSCTPIVPSTSSERLPLTGEATPENSLDSFSNLLATSSSTQSTESVTSSQLCLKKARLRNNLHASTSRGEDAYDEMQGKGFNPTQNSRNSCLDRPILRRKRKISENKVNI